GARRPRGPGVPRPLGRLVAPPAPLRQARRSMPADIEIAAEELDRASRRWEEAAERWRTASHRVPQASLAPGAWAPDLPVTARRFADAHQECVHEVRLRLLAGVDALRETAGALRGQARSYLALDAESARALQVLGQQVLGQQVL